MRRTNATASSAAPVGAVINFSTEPLTDRINTGRGVENIMTPLAKTRPSGGWAVDISIKGMTHRVNGPDGYAVYRSVDGLLKQNGESESPLTIWNALNISWLSRSSPIQQKVSLSALQALQKPKQEEGYGPPHWGSKLWNKLGLMLAMAEEEYEEDAIRLELDTWEGFLASEKIGCPECLEHWLQSYLAADLSDRKSARLFMFNTMNSISKRVGKRTLSYQEAATQHHWD